MAESTTLDYLGREAPVSLSERPALPTGVSLTPSTAPVVSSDGKAPSGTASTAPTLGTPQARAQRFLSLISGQAPSTAKPGAAVQTGEAGAVFTAPPDGAAMFGDTSGSILDQILASVGEKGIEALAKFAQGIGMGGGSGSGVLAPSDFSLSGEGGDVVRPADFSLDVGALNDILPEFLKLQGLFDEGGGVLSPSSFSLSDTEGGPVLAPGDFDLADTTLAADGASSTFSPEGIANIAGMAAKAGGMFTDDPRIRAGLELLSAGANAYANPFMAAFNLPQLASSLFSLLNGNEAAQRRATRTRDALALQGEIVAPLFRARTPEDFVQALQAPVGGSTVGDALAAILWNNLSGTWYGDTAHGWAPDLSYLPLLTVLQDLGYTGRTEPTRGNVGGVGEIVAGGGSRLIPPSAYERGGPLYAGEISDEGGNLSGGAPMRERFGPASRGALGWESTLRALAGVPEETPSTVAPVLMRQGGVRDTMSEGGGFYDPNTGAPVPAETGLPPAYVEALRAFDPGVAQKVEQTAQAALDNLLYNLNFSYA